MSTSSTLKRSGVAVVAALTLGAVPFAASGTATAAAPHDGGAWKGGWATSPQKPTAPFGPNWSPAGFSNHTVRQVVRVTTGGTKARIELSNRYGTTPLKITGATVALTDEGASVKAGTVRELTFGKGRSVTVPAGGTLRSDGVPFKVGALQSVTVTLYLADPTGPATFHNFSSATSYRADGDHRADRDGAAFKETSDSWYFLTGVEVSGGHSARRDGIVTFGDSITDGVGSGLNADNRYPDELAERFAAAGKPRSVVNHGIGGNEVTNDTTWAGEKGIERFKKDVLTEPGVRTVIVLEGINDIGGSGPAFPGGPTPEVSVEQLIEGHRSLIRQAHAKGIKVVGATLTPIGGSFYDDAEKVNEAKRNAVNEWIRTSGEYDAVVDFDRAVADPEHPDRILPAYDSGDHLHPGDAGYRAMAEALDLDRL
ncbi:MULTISPECIES: SGNH/GDSL hydrolase family protein [Streptomyces]|uniref:SGNH/GDSL hydrolase family protein n=1 Tax=Streptomyces solicathayae TaxID=3081768 RepID=A0ABZ0LYV5_9ACTN|nr:SGNH/GDSL hydrolase family protein [Streptomyces sp. HUAS YS2]WOX23954.1 SGNH/GDSL hydrolase family protein [Streptomyces sp. HUAS YS2]